MQIHLKKRNTGEDLIDAEVGRFKEERKFSHYVDQFHCGVHLKKRNTGEDLIDEEVGRFKEERKFSHYVDQFHCRYI